jgi:hypothetical protein
MPIAKTRLLAIVGALLLAAYVVAGLREPPGVGPFSNPSDLLAFSCGTRTALAGADPYLAEPLRACEHAELAASGLTFYKNFVIPAPLPGYDFALFAPLALLPPRVASAAWFASIVIAVAVTGVLLQRLTGLPPLLVAVGLVGADGYTSLVLGQPVPFVVLALVASGLTLRAGHDGRAGIFAGLTLVEPHLGLPLLVALAIFAPRARAALAAICVLLALLAIRTVGFERCVEYLTVVLPAQARGEGLAFAHQYSLSAALHAAGLSASWALRAGSLSYVVMVGLGVAIAGLAARRVGDRALLAFVPVAVSLLGGSYGHIAQMAAGLPLAYVLVARTTGAARGIALAALACLAIPWQALFAEPAFVALFPARPHVDPRPLLANVADGRRLAEEPWDAFQAAMTASDPRPAFVVLLEKVPTWFGLAACAALAARLGQLGKNRRAPR